MANLVIKGKDATTGQYRPLVAGDTATDNSGSPITGAVVLSKYHLDGLNIAYSSATAVVVTSGAARDKTNGSDITLSSETTVSIATINAAAGLERKTLSGTAAVSSSSPNITGTSTLFLTEFAPGNSPRALTGTIGTGGSPLTTITGSGSKFLSQVSVGDLIGNATVGYARVTAIASDTSLTVVSSLTITNGSSGNILENVTIEINSEKKRLDSISSNTAAVADSNYGATVSSQTIFSGSEIINCWYSVWLGTGGSGTTAFLSTQRTTPLGSITGYTSYYRRIGWVRNNSSGDIVAFSQFGTVGDRNYRWEIGQATENTRLLSAGASSGAWASLVASSAAPATAISVHLVGFTIAGNAGTRDIVLRPRNIGSATANRPGYLMASNNNDRGLASQIIPCDGAQAIDYATGTADADHYIDMFGYTDDLTR